MKGFCVTEHFPIVNSQVSFHLEAHIGLDDISIFLTKSHRGNSSLLMSCKKHQESKVVFLSEQVRSEFYLLAIVLEVTFRVDMWPA